MGSGSVLGNAASLLNSVNASSGSTAAADVSSQRESLLSLVASATAGSAGQLDSGTVTATANLLQALTANPAQLSATSQASALSALSSLLPPAASGKAPAPVSSDTANAIAGSAASVALAAVITGSSASNNSNASSSGAAAKAVMSSVAALVDSLAEGQAATLGTGNASAVVISTSAFQLQVTQDNAGSPPSVTLASISAPGSSASFSPLSVSALSGAGGGAVRTKFLSFVFDPHSAPLDAAAAGRNGVTRLVLSAATPAGNGSRRLQQVGFVPLQISNLPHLITFSLPPPSTMSAGANASGLMAACSYYDEASGLYSTAGCVSQPSPLPTGLTVTWVANFSVASSLQLPRAWNFSTASWASPLLAGCSEAWLDCSNASQVNRTIFLNPFAPFEKPGAVTCGGVLSARLLRVFFGPKCQLWVETNSAGCFWNTTAQAFSGPGCVASSKTACGCTHLTGAALGSQPSGLEVTAHTEPKTHNPPLVVQISVGGARPPSACAAPPIC